MICILQVLSGKNVWLSDFFLVCLFMPTDKKLSYLIFIVYNLYCSVTFSMISIQNII